MARFLSRLVFWVCGCISELNLLARVESPMKRGAKYRKRSLPVELPGEVKYRSPTGKLEDRMLAIVTGKTEDGEKVALAKPVSLTAKAA